MPGESKDNGILNDEPSGRKLKVSKPSTSSSTNHALSTILELFNSLIIKIKIPQTTQCCYDNDSFELILNDFFFNILNVKEKTDSSPQFFHDINVFLTKVLFLPIFSNSMLNNNSILFAFFASIIY